MADYRLYLLNATGRIQTAMEFEAANDEGALRHAKGQRDGRAVELWSRARVVAKLAQAELQTTTRIQCSPQANVVPR